MEGTTGTTAQRALTRRELASITEEHGDEEEDGDLPSVMTTHLDVGLALAKPMSRPARCRCGVLSWHVAAVRAGGLRDLARLWAAEHESRMARSAAPSASAAASGVPSDDMQS